MRAGPTLFLARFSRFPLEQRTDVMGLAARLAFARELIWLTAGMFVNVLLRAADAVQLETQLHDRADILAHVLLNSRFNHYIPTILFEIWLRGLGFGVWGFGVW